ncbi:Pyrroline-5-carboxylate reductase catalytic N-terminal domain-containing protein [Flavobacterium longum]|uniref:NADPH-dependent F420 reductase n=1 Tax=Flavobacterium longum TaxID=1299340 RepID=UPI0039ECC0E8
MILAFIGIGQVGFALAHALQQKGHHIIVAVDRPSETVSKALSQNANFEAKPLQEAIDRAEVVFLATPFQANEMLLQSLRFNGKILVDCTNPVGPGISHGLMSTISGSEKVQEWAPDALVVKAFTIYGFENFADSTFPGYNVKPVMMMAGNDRAAKDTVASLVTDLGYEPLNTGALDQALHLEHMTLLWVKMVRRDKHHPGLVWAKLER